MVYAVGLGVSDTTQPDGNLPKMNPVPGPSDTAKSVSVHTQKNEHDVIISHFGDKKQTKHSLHVNERLKLEENVCFATQAYTCGQGLRVVLLTSEGELVVSAGRPVPTGSLSRRQLQQLGLRHSGGWSRYDSGNCIFALPTDNCSGLR